MMKRARLIRPSSSPLLLVIAISLCCLMATAFCGRDGPPKFARPSTLRKTTATSPPSTLNAQDNDDNAMGATNRALSSALSRLDQNWQIQQRAKQKAGQSRWTEMYLNDEEADIDDDTNDAAVDEEEGDSDGVPKKKKKKKRGKKDMVYLLEPPNRSLPSCMIVFFGGAGLGEFPHIAYSEFLTRVSDRLNAAVLSVPYQIATLNHFDLAKRVGELARRALVQCEDDGLLYSTNLPTYCVGHSLGCKLAALYIAATDIEFDGTGYISFNNFGFGRTISMVKEFADVLSGTMGPKIPLSDERTKDILNKVFDFAESAISTIGIEFTPSPEETERLFEIKWDEDRKRKTRLFSFRDDTLHDTPRISQLCPSIDVSQLDGTHLTPVYYRLGIDQIPEEVQDYAREAMGGIESASFGSEAELNALVEEVCGWILGKEPSRKPEWQEDLPQIAATNEGDQ